MWRDIGILCALIATTVIVAIAVWAVVATFREVVAGIRSALRRPRFDLLDLLILVTVLGVSLAAARWFMDSIHLGIVLLAMPMIAPLPWLAKFLYEDARIAREKRRRLRMAVVTSFDLPLPDELAPRPKRRRILPPPKSPTAWLPRLTPLSLAARPLGDDD
jgi:hypothetical protein